MRGIAIAEIAFAAVAVFTLGIGSATASPDVAGAATETGSAISTTTETPQPGWMLPRNVFGNRLGRGLSTMRPARTPYLSGIRPPVVVQRPRPAGNAATANASSNCGPKAQQKDCQTTATASADGATANAAPPPRRIRLNLGSIRPAPNSASFAARTAPAQTSGTSSSILPSIQFQTQEYGEGRRKDRSSSVNITLGRF